ncbi:hypothetical protein GCM10023225_13080 [Kineococcus glutinatus]|uniref:Diguanylate cyclase (GGDEF)-like protein n=1 Tax=Kineococcus glutinatus TaxID=1070872 RepID=A0ABP9HKN9_9ACTN
MLRHVHQRGGPDAVAEVVRRSGTTERLEDLLDEAHWSSYDTRVRLLQAAVDVLDDDGCTFAMGAAALRSGLNHSLVLALQAFGSPRQVYRFLPRAVPKFTTTSTMEVVESGPTHATLRYRLHEGYRHSRLDCRYAQGLIVMVPEMFGLPPATLVHEECESDGAPACVYHVTWANRGRWPWRWFDARRRRDPQLAALRGQLEALQSAAADLAGAEDLSAGLQRITERAAAAVLAPAHLFAVRDPDGGAPLVHFSGLEPQRAAEMAATLLAGGSLGGSAVVVDVTSSRRAHGHLAAVYPDGQRGPAEERSLLGAYAQHAAAALDLLVALEGSRRGEERASVLLALAHEMRAASDADTVADVVASTVPGFVGCDHAAVMFWDAGSGQLRSVAGRGFTAEEQEVWDAALIRADETPELVALLTAQEPIVIHQEQASGPLGTLMERIGAVGCIVVPLLADERLLGVATASWRPGRMPQDLGEVLARLGGVAEYTATALQNTELLARVRHQSEHDALTALPNRVLFTERLEQALLGTGWGTGTAVLFCDLDKFKQVNDVHGHAAGDELLRQVAARLRGVLRTGDTVGRLSGDEFAVLLEGVADEVTARELGQRIVSCFAEPFRVEGRDLHVTTSVGAGVHTGPHGRADDLLRTADGAMYAAKQRGRNQVVVAAGPAGDAGEADEAGSVSLESELRTAVGNGQLRLFFQPVVEVREGCRVAGAEALVRWEHPRLGMLPPSAFLALAEETGVVVEMDLWSLGAACRALASWPRDERGELTVAVNLASRTLLDPRLHATVRSALADSGVAPARLHLEVVESRSLVDVPALAEKLAELRRLGVRTSLDDFGTGYSTLTWLQRLPVDQVKVDRSFTARVEHDPASLALVRGIVALAREVGVEVVAEGVETPEQLAALRAAGCELVQGYLFGRPAPVPPALPAPPAPPVPAAPPVPVGSAV